MISGGLIITFSGISLRDLEACENKPMTINITMRLERRASVIYSSTAHRRWYPVLQYEGVYELIVIQGSPDGFLTAWQKVEPKKEKHDWILVTGCLYL
jgi:hypothetical protein